MAESQEITDLRAKISEAKEALHRVYLGDKVTEVGFGTNRVTKWGQANAQQLNAYISELEAQLSKLLGQPRRGPIYPVGFSR